MKKFIAPLSLKKGSIRDPKTLTQSLLPYPLRRCAAKEMLYGGVRVLHLVPQSPTVIHHSSHELPLPTAVQERDDDRLQLQYIGERVSPINVGNRAKHACITLRNKDLYRRFLQHNRPAMNSSSGTIPPAAMAQLYMSAKDDPSFSVLDAVGKSLGRPRQSVEYINGGSIILNPSSIGIAYSMKFGYYSQDKGTHGNNATQPAKGVNGDDVNAGGTHINGCNHPTVHRYHYRIFHRHPKDLSIFMSSSPVCSARGFLPYQMWNPYADFYHPALRAATPTSPAGRLKQELLNRKGQGERKVQRHLWNQDVDTRGYHPAKFY